MYRGSSFLLQKDYKVHAPIVEEILKPEYDCLCGLACTDLREPEVQMMLTNVYGYIADYLRPMRDQAAGRAGRELSVTGPHHENPHGNARVCARV